jgi:hypothetical protein
MMFPMVVSDHITFLVHVYLLGGDVLATWAVGTGILWEADALVVRHKIALRLVFWGVVIETLCSLALFTFDEGISWWQQAKIIELETRIAPRDLNPDQQKSVAEAIRPFAGTKFMLSVQTTTEPMRLLDQIEDAVIAGGWQEIEPPPPPLSDRFLRDGRGPVGISMMSGVWVVFHGADSTAVRDAALALRKALVDQGLLGRTVSFIPSPRFPSKPSTSG